MHTNRISALARLNGHRTLVVLPLFVALFVYSVQGVWQARADILMTQGVVDAGKDRRAVSLPSGAQVLVLPGASFDVSVQKVLQGEVLANHTSLLSLQAGPYVLEAWRGAFSVTVQGAHVTVAAITAPVVIRNGSQQMVVPIGAQARVSGEFPSLEAGLQAWLSARGVLPLPTHFVRERLHLLEDMPDAVLPSGNPFDVSLPSAVDILRLPAAQVRADAEREHADLEMLQLALRNGDAPQIQSLLLQESVQQVLGTKAGNALMPDFASLAADSGMVPLFLPFFLSHESLWQLAYLHPLTRNHAWVTDGGLQPDAESRVVRLASFPRGDLQHEAASPMAANRWRDEVAVYLQEQKENASPTLDALLPVWAEVVQSMASANLPERTARYSVYLTEITHPYLGTLSWESQALLRDIEALPKEMSQVQFETQLQEAAPIVEHAAPAEERVIGVIDYEGGKDTAIQRLQEAGGMQTPQTSVTVIHGDTVKVLGMLFPTKTGDKPFEFTFDAGTGQLSELRMNGQLLPYSITLEQFVDWVKGE